MITAGLCSFAFVALKSWQQLNVQHDRRAWVMPTSLAMAVFEVAIVVNIARTDSLWLALPIGFGAGCGCLLAMELHRRARRERT